MMEKLVFLKGQLVAFRIIYVFGQIIWKWMGTIDEDQERLGCEQRLFAIVGITVFSFFLVFFLFEWGDENCPLALSLAALFCSICNVNISIRHWGGWEDLCWPLAKSCGEGSSTSCSFGCEVTWKCACVVAIRPVCLVWTTKHQASSSLSLFGFVFRWPMAVVCCCQPGSCTCTRIALLRSCLHQASCVDGEEVFVINLWCFAEVISVLHCWPPHLSVDIAMKCAGQPPLTEKGDTIEGKVSPEGFYHWKYSTRLSIKLIV